MPARANRLSEVQFDPEPWREKAACRGLTKYFFPLLPKNHRPGKDDPYAKAREICAGCPVVAECKADAFRNKETIGMWGGLSGRKLTQRGKKK